MKKICFWLAALSLCANINAQEDNLVMRFDFTNVSGKNVTDDISGITAKLVNSAAVMQMGDYKVLDLGNNNGYLDMTQNAGQLFASNSSYTISVYYYVKEEASLSGNGFFLWAFSTLDACSSGAGAYNAYRLNAQRIASSVGGYSNEKGYSVDAPSPKGSWMHVAYTQQESTGRLYINGILSASVSSMPLNQDMFSTSPRYCWIGRPQFSGDNYLKQTLVGDFRLYNKALSQKEVKALAQQTSDMDNAYIYGTTGNSSALKSAINSADQILNSPEGYLPDAINDLRNLTNYARLIADGEYSQSFYDSIRNQLTSLISVVKASKGVVLPTVSGLVEAYDINRGFIHPGGLHTQEDFDRIKKQLADGNKTVTAAYQVLKSAAYAQPGVQSYPVETIIRGGGVGENYINAARAGTMAYQNGLRWKIEGNKSCAKTAVQILMDWANTTKGIGGDSNYALAAGLYGYEFAQAAELVRDYEGWSPEEFEKFKQWMINVWYNTAIGFLRGRNGTWENSSTWWQAPGHYWSNWPLCNIMCVASIGILCDDVYIYNQAMSFFKYDQVGNFRETPVLHTITGHGEFDGQSAIHNDGLTDFLGNLVVTDVESELETGAYGRIGQMNESGRDAGHSAMAAGLMIDVAKLGWNQGDDLFSYMNHRVASGIEYIAAQTQSVANLPWTNYLYATGGFYYTDYRSQLMTGPVMGTHIRPYWGTVIGIYEGVKGIKMPFSEHAYVQMGIDGGGQGATSGGYDHLGYSVLMNTRDIQLCPAEKVPTELSGKIEYSGTINSNLIPSLSQERTMGKVNGKVISHNELGGLVNTYAANRKTCVPKGNTLVLMPQLPEGEEDTGDWRWNTGETTRNITVTSDKSFIYRVTYKNKNGIESQQCFPIAVEGDCKPTALYPSIVYDGQNYDKYSLDILYGQTPTLKVTANAGWGEFRWSTGQTTDNIVTAPVLAPCDYTVYFTNQGSAVSSITFHLNVIYAKQYITTTAGVSLTDRTIVALGDNVTLSLDVPTIVKPGDISWNDGTTGNKLVLENIQTSGTYTATFDVNGQTVTCTFSVFVNSTDPVMIEPGNYQVRHITTGRLLTSHGQGELATFDAGDIENPVPTQIWFINNNGRRHSFVCLDDSLSLSTTTKMSSSNLSFINAMNAIGSTQYAFSFGTNNTNVKYWTTLDDGTLDITSTKLTDFPYEIIKVEDVTAIQDIIDDKNAGIGCFDLSGRRVDASNVKKGIYIIHGKKIIIK